MEPGGALVLERGAHYTRAQIRAAVGGNGRSALPTSKGKVLCVCLTREKNPRAPGEMVVGGDERALRTARAFAASGAAVPVFVRVSRGRWEYAGPRRVGALVEEPGALLSMIAEGAPPETALALLLAEAAHDAAGGPGPTAAGG